jgi:hypothetical protein
MIDRDTIDISELLELLAIPEIEAIIWNKLESIKTDEPAKLIRSYKEQKKTLRQEIIESKREEVQEADIELSPDIFWFEMFLFNPKSHSWNVVEMEPLSMTAYNKMEIIPTEVIKAIDESPVGPGIIRTITEIWSDLAGKSFNITFIRYSRNNAFGTIRENPDTRVKKQQTLDYTLKENQDMAYKIIFSYMKRYPEIRDYFFNEFFDIIKPMQDRAGVVKIDNQQ